MLSSELEAAIDEAIESEYKGLENLSRNLYENPETAFQEYKAANWISEFLIQRGFDVELGLADMPTAIRVRYGNSKGTRVTILGEYDALPGIGHACGHNLIATGAVAAFIGAAAIIEKNQGELIFLGTPAEEGGGGGKIKMIDAGYFDGIDAAIMFHPFDRDLLVHPALANTWLDIKFKGQPAHVAAAPHDGKNALQACMDTFHLVDGQRIHFRDGVRVHGYITNGGQAVNIITELAACEFSVRARTEPEMERIINIVKRCAKAAAMASDVSVEINMRRGYKNMRNNITLARHFGAYLKALGRSPSESDDSVGAMSTDMGNVSHILPSIHPYIAIAEKNKAMCHQPDFAAAAGSVEGLNSALIAGKAMARIAAELILNKQFRDAVNAEWLNAKP